MCCFILEITGDKEMAYEMKVQVTITKDGQAFSYNENTNSNLDYSNLVFLQGVLMSAQEKLADYAKDKAQKGKK